LSSKFFPPTEKDVPEQSAPQNDGESPSPELLAAKLPDPPTADPSLLDLPEAKKQKVNSGDLGQSVSRAEDKSEDEWEQVDRSEGAEERLDDEPVEVDQAPSAADVQSVQSSGTIDMDESQPAESLLHRDW
jgi:hypothetical protein